MSAPLKVLYVNAITGEISGEILKKGLVDGLKLSKAATQRGLVVDSYDIFYGAKRYPRLMGEWVRDRSYNAIVLSGSEKNTTDVDDPWNHEYYQGLRDLLDIRPGLEHEWDGPPVPVFGICYAHQALACMLGGETARFESRVGGVWIKPLHQAKTNPVFKPLLESTAVEVAGAAQLKVIAYHSDQIIRMPRGFHATFTSDYCAVQGMAHDRFPIFTVQSHPEMNEEIQRDSSDRASWEKVDPKEFEHNAGAPMLAAFLDFAASRR